MKLLYSTQRKISSAWNDSKIDNAAAIGKIRVLSSKETLKKIINKALKNQWNHHKILELGENAVELLKIYLDTFFQ